MTARTITTEICKQAIVDWTQTNMHQLSQQYGGGEPGCDNDLSIGEDDNWEKVWRTKNWKRTCKRTMLPVECEVEKVELKSIVREFNCTPFDDQLRAYVYTNATDTQILKIVVQGE